jgi:hypothetical protein
MKVTYTFDPYEDKEDLQIFQKAISTHLKVHEIEEYLRKLRKYDEREEVPKQEVIDAIIDILYGDE